MHCLKGINISAEGKALGLIWICKSVAKNWLIGEEMDFRDEKNPMLFIYCLWLQTEDCKNILPQLKQGTKGYENHCVII
ncbi:hypothetical protein BZG02_02570 [Labilibaculum filiforme]|uniref:Uncharacterized protein n=1 Tax=Labilibaculum filiforme TaxID=1940526 RepID=A0A2N3I6H2_9BACT|nr:hypothetical protein BZG02_02570 [Labilibaculum filiforme]